MTTSDHASIEDRLVAQLGWVAALAQRLVADPHVADDVLQRVCLLALQRPPHRAPDERSLRAWLGAVTRRLVRHARRAERRRARREELAARPERLPAAGDTAAQREHLSLLVAALTSLDDPDFSALVLRYYEGLSCAQAAARLGIAEAALRKRLSRARARLRTRLERQLGSDGRRWLEGLAPAALLPRAPFPCVPIGGLSMAKVVSAGLLPLSLGVLLVSGAVVGTWWSLRDPPTPATATGAPVPTRSEVPTPELPPPATSRRAAPSTPLAAAVVAEPAGASSEQQPLEEPPVDGSALTALLDDATATFLGDSPDLLGFDRLLRLLARSASVLPDSVARNPLDGSVSGWLAIEGSPLSARFTIDAEGGYRLNLESNAAADLPEGWLQRDVRWNFHDDDGWATRVGAGVQFHPDTTPAGFPALIASLREHGDRIAGWSLGIGPQGTSGDPLQLRASDDGALRVGHLGDQPAWQQGWAHDTSTYDLWLALLRGHAP